MWDDIKGVAGGIWHDGTSFLSAAGKAALAPIWAVVNFLIGKVDYWVNVIVGQTADLYARLSTLESATVGGIINAGVAIYTYVDTKYNQALSYAGTLYNRAISYIQGLYNQAISYAGDVLKELRSFEQSAISWVVSHVYNPLLQLVLGAFAELRSITGAVESWVITHVWNPLLAAIHDAVQAAIDAWHWVTTVGGWLYGLVKGAEQWLIWLATLPFEVAQGLLNDLTHPSARRWIAGAEDAGLGEIGAIEDAVIRWLES